MREGFATIMSVLKGAEICAKLEKGQKPMDRMIARQLDGKVLELSPNTLSSPCAI